MTMSTTWTFSPSSFRLATYHVTVDVLTEYEGESESTAVVLRPVSGTPRVVWTEAVRARPRTGTFIAVVSDWPTARGLLALCDLKHSNSLWLHEATSTGTRYIQFLPLRTRHRVLPEDGDAHEVVIEWEQLGGTY